MHSQTAAIEKVIQETHDTRTLRLRLDKPMEFKCGQFVMVKANINGKIENRAFSISSSPMQDFLDITVKVYPPGKVSPHLYGMKEGERIKIKGPYGNFIFDETAQEIVLIGGGSGIAPLMGMIRYCRDNGLKPNLLLIYGVRTPGDVIFEKELREFERNGLRCAFTVDQPDSNWAGFSGRMNTELIKSHVNDFASPLFYICGPPGMAELVENGLKELNVDKDRIKTDKWL